MRGDWGTRQRLKSAVWAAVIVSVGYVGTCYLIRLQGQHIEAMKAKADAENDQAERVGFGIGYAVGFEDASNGHPERFDVDGNPVDK